MDFRLTPTSGAGNFFAVSGWNTGGSSLHHPSRGLSRDQSRTFEAVLEDGHPEVGEQYRLPTEDGDGHHLMVVEAVDERERDGRVVRVVRLRELAAEP